MFSKVNCSGMKILLFICGLFTSSLVVGLSIKADTNSRIHIKISKLGLNRISNSPYKIIQVTGDDNLFRIENDEDGQNVYFIPLTDIGSKIEISLRNNASQIQDLVLEVADIEGQSIDIQNFSESFISKFEEKYDIALMLKSMQLDIKDKFFVQHIKSVLLDDINEFCIIQTKLYQWKALKGGVYRITNKSNKQKEFELKAFLSKFKNPLASYPKDVSFKAGESKLFFIIQKNVKR